MALRVGIVGVGGIAHCHGRAAREAPEAELAAICDVSRDALDRFGGTFDVFRRYTDLARMLREVEIDILSICTWGNSHADIAIQAALTGRVRAILCEKPISSTAAECEAMIEAAREHGVLLAEAFKFRHHPCHLRAKELIDAGEIGQVRLIRNTFTAAVDPVNLRPDYNWRFNREKRGGATYDLGCYCIHHARFVAGCDPDVVHARGHYGPQSQVPESVLAQLEFPNEISAQCAFSFRFHSSQEFEVFGTEGYMRMTWPGTTKIARSRWKSEKTTGRKEPSGSRLFFSSPTSCGTFATVWRPAGLTGYLRRTAWATCGSSTPCTRPSTRDSPWF